ncbi:pyruvate:ferredoxin (flavodoxin) oxidoreductase [Veillonella criceti]|uniref:Pyruvate synthase subunit porA n=1 Tax=Veillonella criceti TaxID=103891 RepID=A0A380NLM9_9FIRM|nr:pyruvate:ferredoxin (flavodoxin) oxidoreductase [Veillonella criceti]SUP43809.1 Pyruvate synthase subunit porA [Veillonella criceti]
MRKMKTMDGNQAAAHVSYGFTEVAAIYPITPSSPMPEFVDEWSANGRKNIFGHPVKVVEMQSEAGAAGAVHGSLQTGALTTTFTSAQGLLLMIPNLYKVAGELLPGVFQVASRALATHALSIFGDHQDVMAVRATGCAMLAESSVQEVMDLSAVAHLAAIKGRVPFINFFDGFRTSHEIQKIEMLDYEELAPLVDQEAVMAFRKRAMNPDTPVTRGTAENPDVYFTHREASNSFYLNIPQIVEDYMAEISKLTGREYHLFNYVGAPDATDVVVVMGAGAQVANETVDYLMAQGRKVGALNVHLFRPFAMDRFIEALPKTVKRIAVLDRTKEPGSMGEPLFLDVQAAIARAKLDVLVVGGRYGLGSRDVIPADMVATFDNLEATEPKAEFTIGIVDDVTGLSLPRPDNVWIDASHITACKFWGFGSDGTVGANKTAIKIIGDHTDMYAQAYFDYDSKKSGGVTMSHLRFGKQPINKPYLVTRPTFVACHRQAYVNEYDILQGIEEGGTFLLNCTWSIEELAEKLPASMRRTIASKHLKFYIINAAQIAQDIGLGGRINMICQAAFFKLANIIPIEEAVQHLKDSVIATYGKKGQKVIDMNTLAIDKGVSAIVPVEVPADWANAVDTAVPIATEVPEYVHAICKPINAQQGYGLPVSTFLGYEDGTLPNGTAAYEKRGVALAVPHWHKENCIQCNQCAFVCPHATIRPILATAEEVAAAPTGFETIPALGTNDLQFRIAVSPLDCLGCGNCVNICPAPKGKAITMSPIDDELHLAEAWQYGVALPVKPNPMKTNTVKGSQFETPLLEFSGACAGCGETPYAKLVTQLFGDRMMIANAAGCSSIWGGSMPTSSYTTNQAGHGPTWGNSLFEDNAEYGYGMRIGTTKIREQLSQYVEQAISECTTKEQEPLKEALTQWLTYRDQGEGTRNRSDLVIQLLEKEVAPTEAMKAILEEKQYLPKRSQWIFGGDGWAYDIGFGGLDHVLASGDDVNILVFDTEVYSNTGGQSSKATHTAAVAKFAASGKRTKKKDLGMIAMSYGYVYVAQVAMGADKNQLLKAVTEAEAYPGPSLIIAYAPCINHGIKSGMGTTQEEARRAVAAGYWDLYRYNPALRGTGKNPFSLDSKEPTESFRDFLMGEVRYASLQQSFPEIAEELFEKTEQDAKERRASYVRLQAGFEQELGKHTM